MGPLLADQGVIVVSLCFIEFESHLMEEWIVSDRLDRLNLALSHQLLQEGSLLCQCLCEQSLVQLAALHMLWWELLLSQAQHADHDLGSILFVAGLVTAEKAMLKVTLGWVKHGVCLHHLFH